MWKLWGMGVLNKCLIRRKDVDMKRIVVIALVCCGAMGAYSQALNKTYLSYIEKYRYLAIEQQRRHKVPAAITMAQGLLESAAGTSELAVQANNHFGVKCTTDWPGKTYTHDDETANECFRQYADVGDSYEDHSLFLHRKRYESLFTLPIGDYKNWAYGLKACGYATDPKYAEKLIRLIETYELNKLTFDTVLVASGVVSAQDTAWTETPHEDVIAFADQESVEDYETPTMGSVELYGNHQSGRRNGVRYIVAKSGDTFASLAEYLDMYERTLRRYNDALDTRELEEGDIVYLYPKKHRADIHHKSCVVKKGDTAWSLSQKYGIRMKSLYKLNGIPYGTPLTTVQRLDLR